MSHEDSPSPSHRYKHGWRAFLVPIVLAALGLVAFGLGFLGYWKLSYSSIAGRNVYFWPDAAWDCGFNALDLFFLHVPDNLPPLHWNTDWGLQVARALAPLVVGFTTLRAYCNLASAHHRRLRHLWKSKHVIICGLSRKGLQLAKSYRRRGRWVAVLEEDPGNSLLAECDLLDIPYWIGDAAEMSQLKWARVHRADLIIALTGNDGKNAEIALRAHNICRQARSALLPPLRCFVHIVEPQLRQLLRQQRIFRQQDETFQVSMFDFYEKWAQALFQKTPLDGPNGIAFGCSTSARLVIVGFGQMGESIALQGARLGHFANGKKLDLTVIDPNASSLKQGFYRRYPNYNALCEAEFLDAPLESPEIAARLQRWRKQPNSVLTFVVCRDDDSSSMTAGMYLKSKLKEHPAPILVRMSSRGGLASLLPTEPPEFGSVQSTPQTNLLHGINSFGTLDQLSTPGMVVDETLDTLAKRIHDHFILAGHAKALASAHSPRDDAGMHAWDVLEEDYRNSNRQQALHLQIKLRAFGMRLAPDNFQTIRLSSSEEVVKNFIDDLTVEVMAKMEHARWCAERLLAGWEYAPEENRMERLHPDLVPWDQLSEASQAKARNIVRMIPTVSTILQSRKISQAVDS
ncbi:MAG TPA: NAD-binding protein [Candidatus Baltobacteraceae bacterium]|nr:NAD-binding protein [Candidatus Baltobacteraceae bacterium]